MCAFWCARHIFGKSTSVGKESVAQGDVCSNFSQQKTKNKNQQFVTILNNNKNIFSRHQQHIVHKRFKVLVDIKNSISYVVGDLCLDKNYDD